MASSLQYWDSESQLNKGVRVVPHEGLGVCKEQIHWRGRKGKEEKWNNTSDSNPDTNAIIRITLSENHDCSHFLLEELNPKVMSSKAISKWQTQGTDRTAVTPDLVCPYVRWAHLYSGLLSLAWVTLLLKMGLRREAHF